MRRIQGMEVLDLAAIPPSLRRASMEYLKFAFQVTGQARALLPKVNEALATSGLRQVVDLCSGGSGPWPILAPLLKDGGSLDGVTLTDLFPDPLTFAEAERGAPGVIKGNPLRVDATAVPPSHRGLRTIFNAFHHFAPTQARQVLQAAVDAGVPIAIFEVVGREAVPLLGLSLFSSLAVLLSVPFVRPFRWSTLAWTYLLPALPLIIAFDGTVSCLRAYSEPELRELVGSLRDPGYRWDIGRIRLGSAPIHSTFLIGYPPRRT